MRYFGPFPVIERIGSVAYKLQLPPATKIHPVFHSSQLKLCKGDHFHPYVPLPITHTDANPVLFPYCILQNRVIIKGNQHIQQHLVQWEGLGGEHATWEDHTALKTAFPNFNLEDKVVLNGGGIVTNKNIEGENEEMVESQDARPGGQVAADVQNLRRSDRIKITNSRLKEYVCAGYNI